VIFCSNQPTKNRNNFSRFQRPRNQLNSRMIPLRQSGTASPTPLGRSFFIPALSEALLVSLDASQSFLCAFSFTPLLEPALERLAPPYPDLETSSLIRRNHVDPTQPLARLFSRMTFDASAPSLSTPIFVCFFSRNLHLFWRYLDPSTGGQLFFDALLALRLSKSLSRRGFSFLTTLLFPLPCPPPALNHSPFTRPQSPHLLLGSFDSLLVLSRCGLDHSLETSLLIPFLDRVKQ